jgi:competence protein ComGC
MRTDRQKSVAFTLIELLVTFGMIALLAALLVPALGRAKEKSRRISCTCNLKQTGLSSRLFANDHADLFPMGVSTNQGGSIEFLNSGEAFRHFRALSNQLSTTRVLVCPADTRKPALAFSVLSNTNVSYFLGLDADETMPQLWLAGDRNLATNGVPLLTGLVQLTPGAAVGWTRALHRGVGNVALSDGSVQGMTTAGLQAISGMGGTVTNRLAIP